MTEALIPERPPCALNIALEVILGLLVPLFMGNRAAANDPNHARIAALEMLDSFRVRDGWELLTGAQITSFGVAALGSIALSVQPGLTPPMIMRLRGSASSLSRSGNDARKALDAYRITYPDAGPIALTPAMAADLAAQSGEAQRLRAEAAAALGGATPARAQPMPAGAPPGPSRAPSTSTPSTASAAVSSVPRAAAAAGTAPPTARPAPRVSADVGAPARDQGPPPGHAPCPGPQPAEAGAVPGDHADASRGEARVATQWSLLSEAERRHRATWAWGMATAAQEMTAEMAHLPPAERRENQIKIDALSSVARNLLSGAPHPTLQEALPELAWMRAVTRGSGGAEPGAHPQA